MTAMNIAPSFSRDAGETPLSAPSQAGMVATGAPSLVQQYAQIAYRRRWTIIGTVVGAVLLGLVATLLMTPQYTGTATIEISRDAAQLTEFEGAETKANPGDQEFYQTQYGLLKARTLAERVANQLKLVDDPEFYEMFDRAGDDPAFEMANGRYVAARRPARQRIAGEILLDNVAINPARFSRLVDIEFTSPQPSLSANVANAWAENFIQSNLERKVQATSYGREQLQRQLADYKDRLNESQRQLVAYASQQEIINLPAASGGEGTTTQERSILADDLAALNGALAEATAARIAAQAKASTAGSAGATSEALNNNAINSLRQRRAELQAEYQELMVRFEPGYPAARALQSQITNLDQAISREERRVSGSLEADYRAALQREQMLFARVGQLKDNYLDLRRRSIQYNIYQQEVDTNRALYDGLLQRFKEIGVAGGIGVNNVSIIDPADVPEDPSSPSLVINILISLLAGLALGVALALLVEQLNEAITDPAELQRRLGLPLLGVVPKTDDRPEDALLDRKSEVVEGYMAVQTNLSFATEHGVPRSISVTSTRPAEGKSTTALALATTLTRINRKVILIDGDMRSPSVHHLGNVGHERGLSNFLAGQDDIENMTFEMTKFGFTAMSAGPIPPNAAELLSGNRLSLLIERLLQTYDHVLIDSPPVLGLADAPLIASRVEGVIYAVESHRMRVSTVKTAINRLLSTNAHLLGAVLTMFENRKSNYGYNYAYTYSYGRDEVGAQ
jgi:polysaccharide biosynthesis transport protein